MAFLGGSPGLVVMGDDSCLRGRGFESWMDMTFFTLIYVKNFIVGLKRGKGRGLPIFKDWPNTSG